MTNGVTASLSVRLSASDFKAPPVGGASHKVDQTFALALAAGVGVGNADTLLTKAINIAGSGSATVDLSGATPDAFGANVAFAEIQVVMLIAATTNANNIVLGNGATDPWLGPFDAGTDTISVKPGGILLWADPAGWPVTATTADLLKLANSSSGAAVVGTLILIGRSA